MPIYEYRCQECGHELEALQKISAEPLKDCPDCGAPALKKKISAVAFRLKGSGWYETDFKSGDKQKNIVKDDNAAESKTDSKKPDAGSSEKTATAEKKDSGKAETTTTGKSETKAATST